MKSAKYERVTINVSGDVYETYRNTLKRFPETLLGDFNKIQPYYIPRWNVYFFDRCRLCFGAILYFYQSKGLLHCPVEVSVDVFVEECNFYQIPHEIIHQMKIKKGRFPDLTHKHNAPGDTSSFRKQVWAFIDYPESSEAARWYAIISFIIISLSIVSACLETIPEMKVSDHFSDDPWAITELILNIWFLLEFFTRVVFAPNKLKFINSVLNWIDACAVIPYFMVPFFSDTPIKNFGFLRILKFVRVMRLFRLSKHSKRLKVVGEIIKSSIPDFQLLMLCFGIAVVFGGSIIYFAEKSDVGTDFKSIPDAFWWAIQAITTVGYGDIIPQTIPGRFLAAAYSVLGVMTLSLPVLAIVTKFTMFYEKNIDCSPWD